MGMRGLCPPSPKRLGNNQPPSAKSPRGFAPGGSPTACATSSATKSPFWGRFAAGEGLGHGDARRETSPGAGSPPRRADSPAAPPGFGAWERRASPAAPLPRWAAHIPLLLMGSLPANWEGKPGMALIGGRGAGCFSSSPALALAAAPPGPCPAPQLPGPGPWLGAGADGFVSFLAKLLSGFPHGKGLSQARVRGQLRPAPRGRNLGKKISPGWCRAPRSQEEMRTPLSGPKHQKYLLKNQRIPFMGFFGAKTPRSHQRYLGAGGGCAAPAPHR